MSATSSIQSGDTTSLETINKAVSMARILPLWPLDCRCGKTHIYVIYREENDDRTWVTYHDEDNITRRGELLP